VPQFVPPSKLFSRLAAPRSIAPRTVTAAKIFATYLPERPHITIAVSGFYPIVRLARVAQTGARRCVLS